MDTIARVISGGLDPHLKAIDKAIHSVLPSSVQCVGDIVEQRKVVVSPDRPERTRRCHEEIVDLIELTEEMR